MRRYLAALLAALQLLSLSALAAEWDPGDPMLWEPDLPTFDGPMPRPGETAENFSIVLSFTGDMLLASLHGKRTAGSAATGPRTWTERGPRPKRTRRRR